MGTWNCLMLLSLALPSVLSMPYQEQGSLLYPYGPAYNDWVTDKEDDGSTEAITLQHSFVFFQKTWRKCYVNNNGAVSFNKQMADYTPDAFPIKGVNMICPYWADTDNECGGEIYVGQRTDESFLKRTSDDLNSVFKSVESHVTVVVVWALVVTWDQVAYHGTESNKTNTFQCVLMSDKYGRSYVMFNYHDINWTTGTASGGDAKTGVGGVPAQAGFNTENNYFNMPSSRTPHIINIKSTTNCGRPGRWVFRVDEFMSPTGCMHKDSLLNYGLTMWTDETCSNKCTCRHDGKVQCYNEQCPEGLVCLPAGRYYQCQIDDDC